jgi:hexokinase
MELNIIEKNTIIVEDKVLKFPQYEIKVKGYISAEEKLKLINATVQVSKIDGKINPVVLEVAFNTLMIEQYTDIELTEEERADLFRVYDVLEQNNIIDAVMKSIPEIEYNALQAYLKDAIDIETRYDYSIIGVVSRITEALPSFLENITEQLKDFDPSKYQHVLDLANQIKQ